MASHARPVARRPGEGPGGCDDGGVLTALLPASFPSPSSGVIHIGPLPLRGYAAAIILGVVFAARIGNKRSLARGGPAELAADAALWGVPAGIVGARIYHLITSPQAYFGKGGNPVQALEIWKGGLGIWGGVLAGAIAVWIWGRRNGMRFLVLADILAPGVAVAQAVGRVGNYLNQELYGRATNVPWAVRIDAEHSPNGVAGTFHPTFAYEAIWDLAVWRICVWADKRWQLGSGRVMALYVATYCVGRAYTESLRVDTANHFFGLRLNDIVAGVVFVLALAYFIAMRGQAERRLYLDGFGPDGKLAAASDGPVAGTVDLEKRTQPQAPAAAGPSDVSEATDPDEVAAPAADPVVTAPVSLVREQAESDSAAVGAAPVRAESDSGTVGAVPVRAESDSGTVGVVPVRAESDSGTVGAVPVRAESDSAAVGAVPVRAESDSAEPEPAEPEPAEPEPAQTEPAVAGSPEPGMFSLLAMPELLEPTPDAAPTTSESPPHDADPVGANLEPTPATHDDQPHHAEQAAGASHPVQDGLGLSMPELEH